ncbi:hypothetical protein FRC07_000822 [Ceratobasidium sp. 392]|nr:hypothetical protein FRC07_000822 [Ceratobasidium sp. 392]
MSFPIAISAVTGAAPQLNAIGNPRFELVWTVRSRFQRGTLCAAAVSPSERWLASASYDSNLIFIDFKTGQLTGVLDLESRFHIISISKQPITMRPILRPFDLPIKAIALDPLRNFLAIGCGGDTYVFSRPSYGDSEDWELIEHVSAPCEGPDGLVTSLNFYGNSMQQCQLFIGHTRGGFCIWRGPQEYQRTPYEEKGNVCSIGDAAFSRDGRFIAIVTLEHSIVLYPMTEAGPVLQNRHVLENSEKPGFRPIVPIALGPDNLVMRGSASGTVPIVDLQHGDLAPIRNDPHEVIRVLTTCGDKVIVGLSDKNGKSSKIKCYLDLTASSTPPPRLQQDPDQPLFTVAIGELEDQAGSYRTIDGLQFRALDRVCKSLVIQLSTWLGKRLRSRRVWQMIVFFWLFTMMLVVDPPALPGHAGSIIQASQPPDGPWGRSSTEVAVRTSGTYLHGEGFMMHEGEGSAYGNGYATGARDSQSTMGAHGGQSENKRAKYPALGALFSYCGLFVLWRLTCWGSWFLMCLTIMVGYTFKGLVFAVCIVPYLIKHAAAHLPDLMVVTVCEILQAFGDVPICPK